MVAPLNVHVRPNRTLERTQPLQPLIPAPILPGMDVRTTSAMTRGWALVGQVLAWLAALDGLVLGWMPGRAWGRAFAELRRAEGLARRLVIALAAEMPALPADPPAPAATSRRAPHTTPPRTRAPGFPLFDPLGALCLAPAAERVRTGTGEVPHAIYGLQCRIAALQDVLADPSGAAARMARFLSAPRPGRTSPLRPGAPPGWSIRMALKDAGDRYREAHHAALCVLNHAREGPAPVS